ncbi:Asp/Glu racemase [Novacetimonas hansenii]|uniref:Hydantoin racemase n=2 Tax=Novacetimonas hansenii TaxID=436 RepID=A0ABQ0SCF0_NOVHA|nr:aspartate/glutamate racemase family protein [Novacetimonas hansenii]EFG84234.1 putative hydantoin racemase [Novacetimonas hansenii ATCC 23769]GAN83198.1 hydantoin racemase [Novacetimonas hansenii JCM 7643]GBQ61641.1 hydantoin racemase [Novacetimonas hansenii NRIC 0243]GEC62822.1 hydantoin racemase [Novacetimonas hansenii]
MNGRGRILILNPNSSAKVTDVIEAGIAGMRGIVAHDIDVICLPEGPLGIATQADADRAAVLVQEKIRTEPADAYIISCFSDPGLLGSREEHAGTGRIILGCGESAILHALTHGDKFGIIALSPLSCIRQARIIRMMGLTQRYVGSQSIDASAESAATLAVAARMIQAGRQLMDKGTNTVILGCAGMAHFCPILESALGIPVMEPTIEALAMAMGRMGLRQARAPEEPQHAQRS